MSLSWFPCGSNMPFKLEFENARFSGKGSGQRSKPFKQIKARINTKLKLRKIYVDKCSFFNLH